jgi:hypothetical protein
MEESHSKSLNAIFMHKKPCLYFCLLLMFLISSCVTVTKTIQGIDLTNTLNTQPYQLTDWKIYQSSASRFFIFGNMRFRREFGIIQPPQITNFWQMRQDSTGVSVSQTPFGFVPPQTPFGLTLMQRAYSQAVFAMIAQNPDMEVVGQPIFEVETINGFIFYNRSRVTIKVRLGKR